MALNTPLSSTARRLALLALTLAATGAHAAWLVDNAASQLSFVTTKASQAGVGGVQEVQRFKSFQGGVDAQGRISLSVDLASVDTGVEIRDERLRTLLFNSAPAATFSAQLATGWATGLDKAPLDLDVAGQFTLAGQARPMTAKLRVARLGDGRLWVASRAPLVVSLADHGQSAGVEALRAVMGLNYLAGVAPVSLSLTLNEQK
jgi:polyisoprenoid-binding protein YceI